MERAGWMGFGRWSCWEDADRTDHEFRQQRLDPAQWGLAPRSVGLRWDEPWTALDSASQGSGAGGQPARPITSGSAGLQRPRQDLARDKTRDCWSAPRLFGQHSTAPQTHGNTAQHPDRHGTHLWSHSLLIMSASLRLCCGDTDTLSLVSCLGRAPVPFSLCLLPCSALLFALALLLLLPTHPSLCRCAVSHSSPPPRVSFFFFFLHTVGVRKCSVGLPLPTIELDHNHKP